TPASRPRPAGTSPPAGDRRMRPAWCRRWPGRRRARASVPRILIATNNPGKLEELRALLLPSGWTPLHPAGLGLALDVAETGTTYAENAALKAAAFANTAQMIALADDSGLEVDALDGRPGVYSARYGGPGTPPAEQIRMLLHELEQVPEPRRTARFRSVVVIATPEGQRWQ